MSNFSGRSSLWPLIWNPMMALNDETARRLRKTLGTFTTGVTIITTKDGDGLPIGVTVNSFSSVSLSPPLVLWSLARNAYSRPVFEEAGYWAVHILSHEQDWLSSRFAQAGIDKFSGVAIEPGVNGLPLLKGCAARLQCRTWFKYEGGDHIIFLGEVVDFETEEIAPLVFQAGKYAVATHKSEQLSLSAGSATMVDAAYSEDYLGYLLWRAYSQFLLEVKPHLESENLSVLEYYILLALAVRDGRSLEQINAFTVLADERGSLEVLIRLQELELIGAGAVSMDTPLSLTLRGCARITALMEAGKKVEATFLDRLGILNVVPLKNLLKRLISKTDPGIPHPWDRMPEY